MPDELGRSWPGRAYYRIRQFWQSATAGPLEDDSLAEIAAVLNEPAMELFSRQTNGGQRHAYRVMSSLRNDGHNSPELLQAALLHDTGKTIAPVRWWDWPLVVLAEAILPARAREWAKGDLSSWRRPFVVKAYHAEWGAAAAKAAGCSDITCALIRHHQDPVDFDSLSQKAEDQWLELLVLADNRH